MKKNKKLRVKASYKFKIIFNVCLFGKYRRNTLTIILSLSLSKEGMQEFGTQ